MHFVAAEQIVVVSGLGVLAAELRVLLKELRRELRLVLRACCLA